MYFLTNKENYIIAASSDFLTNIGSRDVCSISTMLQNKLIILEDDKLTIPNKDLEYKCNISTMHSAFGNLNLHVLTVANSNSQTDEEKTYIDKLHDVATDKKDNEYDIPDIPTLHKDEAKSEEDTKTYTETIDKSEEKEELLKEDLSETKKEDTEDSIKEVKKDVPQEIDSAESQEKKDTENNIAETNIDEKINQEPKNSKLIDILKNIDTDTEDKNLNITTDTSIDKLADELIETENIDTLKSNVNNNIAETPKEVENFVEHSSDDIINQIEEIEESGSKKSGLKKITKKLFPWSSKKNQAIELEGEETTPYQIDIKSASELEEASKETSDTLKSTEDKIKDETVKLTADNEVKVEKEEIKIPEIPTVALEQDDVDNNVEESIKELEKITLNKEPETTAEDEYIKIPEIPTVDIEKPDLSIDSKTSTDTSEKIGLVNLEEDKIDLENENLTTNKSIEVDNDNKIDTLKEQISQISTEEESEKEAVEKSIVVADETDREDVKNNSIAYKVIKLQVDGIDFEKNANKLSIDTSSYKMLLTNYLDEIEKYNRELENGVSSTIDMLQDAGKLLSLDILTQKLGQLKSEGDRVSLIREISLISSLLKEKMDKKEESVKAYEEPKVEIAEVVEDEQTSTTVIPDDIIDITSAQELLTSINPQSVSFNPNRAAEELNLPKTLIIEFIEDFIAQSKEHLPVMVEAYKKEDIKTIQTTAHMLKGAASNLRLDTIAENLFKIQKEGNINNSGELIKQFVAKLKGLNSEVATLEDIEDEN